MDNIFNSVKLSRPARNLFDLSYDNKLTLEFGELVPVLCQEMLPGDEVKLQQEVYCRFMPTLSPIMHKCDVYLHTFFVPNRLIYDQWNDFLTNGKDGMTPEIPPYVTLSMLGEVLNMAPRAVTDLWPASATWQYPLGSLADYLGLPTVDKFWDPNAAPQGLQPLGDYGDIPISLLPFRAYQLVYNEYYRDENLIPELQLAKDGGLKNRSYWQSHRQELKDLFSLRRRAWRKDYFTASLPWTQRGAQVLLPISGTAQVSGNLRFSFDETEYTGARHWLAMNPGGSTSGNFSGGALAQQDFSQDGTWSTSTDGMYVQLTGASTTSINDFRVALRVQEWLEKNARCGSRYIEQILAHFGVMTPDARLQRPEFLGGSKSTLTVSEVLQSSPYDSQKNVSPVGLPAGKVTGYDNNSNVRYYVYEHGFLLTIASVMPKANYFQGVPKMWSRLSLMDYYWPEFANLGEQSTYRREIFVPFGVYDADPAPSYSANDTFGYMPRYMEYRCNEDSIHCDFRASLDFWHLARKFEVEPSLNRDFIEVRAEEDGLNRIFAVTPATNGKHILLEVFNDFQALRPLPVYAVPSLA